MANNVNQCVVLKNFSYKHLILKHLKSTFYLFMIDMEFFDNIFLAIYLKKVKASSNEKRFL